MAPPAVEELQKLVLCDGTVTPAMRLRFDGRSTVVRRRMAVEGSQIASNGSRTVSHRSCIVAIVDEPLPYSLITFADIIADRNFCRQPVNQNTPIGRVLGGWAWLTCVTLAVIGRPSKITLYNSSRCHRQ